VKYQYLNELLKRQYRSCGNSLNTVNPTDTAAMLYRPH